MDSCGKLVRQEGCAHFELLSSLSRNSFFFFLYVLRVRDNDIDAEICLTRCVKEIGVSVKSRWNVLLCLWRKQMQEFEQSKTCFDIRSVRVGITHSCNLEHQHRLEHQHQLENTGTINVSWTVI